jgi:chromosome segregation ATPase
MTLVEFVAQNAPLLRSLGELPALADQLQSAQVELSRVQSDTHTAREGFDAAVAEQKAQVASALAESQQQLAVAQANVAQVESALAGLSVQLTQARQAAQDEISTLGVKADVAAKAANDAEDAASQRISTAQAETAKAEQALADAQAKYVAFKQSI